MRQLGAKAIREICQLDMLQLIPKCSERVVSRFASASSCLNNNECSQSISRFQTPVTSMELYLRYLNWRLLAPMYPSWLRSGGM